MDTVADLTLPCLVHDLNNVFQTLVEAGDLLSSDPHWASLAAVIVRSVERGKAITSSLQSGGHEGAPIAEIVRHAISFVEDSAGGNPPIRFECRLEPHIVLRRNWAWERVFINLFSNSRRAMPAGGSIEVSARSTADGIEIVVRDDGPGIAPELLGDIFHPGVSTQSSAGLGLHIVDTIVRQDEGSVRAMNRSGGRGAEFVITLPASAAEAMPRAVPAHAG